MFISTGGVKTLIPLVVDFSPVDAPDPGQFLGALTVPGDTEPAPPGLFGRLFQSFALVVLARVVLVAVGW